MYITALAGRSILVQVLLSKLSEVYDSEVKLRSEVVDCDSPVRSRPAAVHIYNYCCCCFHIMLVM